MNIDPSEIRALVRIVTRQTGAPVHDEDLEQDATLRAVEAFRKQLDVRYPRAFLLKVVRDAVRDHWRKRRAMDVLDALDESCCSHTPSFEEDLDRRHQAELLWRALKSIDSGKRAALDLFYVEERSVIEIAKLQGKSISAVKMDLHRTRRRLAEIVRSLASQRRQKLR